MDPLMLIGHVGPCPRLSIWQSRPVFTLTIVSSLRIPSCIVTRCGLGCNLWLFYWHSNVVIWWRRIGNFMTSLMPRLQLLHIVVRILGSLYSMEFPSLLMVSQFLPVRFNHFLIIFYWGLLGFWETKTRVVKMIILKIWTRRLYIYIFLVHSLSQWYIPFMKEKWLYELFDTKLISFRFLFWWVGCSFDLPCGDTICDPRILVFRGRWWKLFNFGLLFLVSLNVMVRMQGCYYNWLLSYLLIVSYFRICGATCWSMVEDLRIIFQDAVSPISSAVIFLIVNLRTWGLPQFSFFKLLQFKYFRKATEWDLCPL